MNTTNRKQKYKTIKINVTEEEHQILSVKANEMKYSINQYVKLKALDERVGAEQLSRQIMQMMPAFYNQVDQLEDTHARHWMMEFGGAVCRCLK